MTLVVKRRANSPFIKSIEYHSKARPHDWRSIGAIVGLAGGIVAAITGSVLTVASWLMRAGGAAAFVETTGTVLLAIMVPLLIFGAHCLDLTEKRKNAERASRFKD